MALAIGALARSAMGAMARSGRMGSGTGAVSRGWEAAKRYRSTKGTGKDQEDLGRQLGVNLLELIQSIKEWRASVVESGKALANYNATIAKSYQTLAIGDHQRKLRLARGTAGTTAALVGEENKFRDASLPWEQLKTNLSNQVAMLVTRFASSITEALGPIAQYLDKLVKIEEQKPSGGIFGLEPFAGAAARHDRRIQPIDMG